MLQAESGEDLCQSILPLLSDADAAAAAGKAARAWAEENLDARVLARQQVARYRELLG